VPAFVAAVNGELRALAYRRQLRRTAAESRSAAWDQYRDMAGMLERLSRDLGVVLAFRFLFAPALSVLFSALIGVGGLANSVIAVESAMPVVTQSVVASTEYGADEQFAAQGSAISTLACFIVIPILMVLL
jgi:predicted Na+-dependent transporter